MYEIHTQDVSHMLDPFVNLVFSFSQLKEEAQIPATFPVRIESIVLEDDPYAPVFGWDVVHRLAVVIDSPLLGRL
jgi:hypothetical protein